jgi:hypothetical protein
MFCWNLLDLFSLYFEVLHIVFVLGEGRSFLITVSATRQVLSGSTAQLPLSEMSQFSDDRIKTGPWTNFDWN